jgi:hypothetical protein
VALRLAVCGVVGCSVGIFLVTGGAARGVGSRRSVSSASAEWGIEPVPARAHTERLFGVSCAAPTACIAVGSVAGARRDFALAKRWNGKRWSIQTIRQPPGPFPNSDLYDVSCPSSTACIAVGNVLTNSQSEQGLAERWDGKRWSPQSTPFTQAGALSGVSCASSSACTAVGGYTALYKTPDSNYYAGHTLVERWDGTHWSIQPAPSPADGFLNDVSCTSPTVCTAVGGILLSNRGATLMIESWDGTTWSIQPSPNPGNGSVLQGVSCTSSTACVAVGVADYYHRTLVERWDGASWSIQPTPRLPRASDISLIGVSCTSSTACTAVGKYNIDRRNVHVTLAERWNGKRWSIQPSQNARSRDSRLEGVSCASRTTCMGVGYYTVGPPIPTSWRPLSERWSGRLNVRKRR